MLLTDLAIPASLASTVRLRPMTGQDELLIRAADPSSAFSLLSRLATDANGDALDLGQMTISQVDRLLAGLYVTLYGDRAECRVRCRTCGERFEFTLILSDLIAAQDADRPQPPGLDGTWTLPDKRKVRAPMLEDISSASDPESLLARLVISGDPSQDPDIVTDFLERAVPVLSIDLDVACPYCQQEQLVRFDLVRYFSRRLAGERAFLLREAHLIATHYGWSHREIMVLSRDDRRAYSGLIEVDRAIGHPARSRR